MLGEVKVREKLQTEWDLAGNLEMVPEMEKIQAIDGGSLSLSSQFSHTAEGRVWL